MQYPQGKRRLDNIPTLVLNRDISKTNLGVKMSKPGSDKDGIRQIYRALVEAGYTVNQVFDGGDEPVEVSNEREAVDAVTAVDEASFNVQKDGKDVSWVFFVLGNDPEEVVNDYGTSLSHVIDSLTESWWDFSDE